ncbi:MAG: xanthine dehydrogenase accessory protein XdhC [Bdellovibrionales bacterium GWC1_52_8]|nr:MAG: xanthine dehydrogenase accessory protein XdhC [Bdellovibrionales bacterium GWB1_52_6]OFZ04265.1 MAG: xanthine dehydrogenase accessory protein XdhC [Bdellovibrionales bacterium GWA1_52_35]OFZ42914.1 MAG: xanthine dehydrogenase accessory protein XdhC [Bdellovibrionales bacterium GWC1_52_8]HCM40889.1 xanthine dehydrogenase accessory protein XdhC [Bdellovibrionales bacterium]
MWNWVAKLQELINQGKAVAVVTVTRCSGSTPRETGAKMLVLANGTFLGTIGGGQLEKQVVEDSIRCLNEGKSRTLHFPLHASVGQCCGGVVELLVEVINQGPELYLFGGGHVGQALAKTLQDTPFRVTLIDERPEWATPAIVPAGVKCFCEKPSAFLEQADFQAEKTYVVIMTHDHELDLQILSAILRDPSKFKRRYLGLIGSGNKWKSFQAKLKSQRIDEEQIQTVRCPVGIDIGGKSPQEVSISIAAELLKIHYGK